MGFKDFISKPFRWIGRHAFNFVCDRAFEKVDVDKNGFLDVIEIELATLYMYNSVNKRMPGWEEPPNRAKVQEAINVFDKDGNKKLDKMEFRDFVRSLAATGPDAFFARIGKNMAITTGVMPGVAYAVKKGAEGTALGAAPLAILAPVIGTIYKSIRGVIPV